MPVPVAFTIEGTDWVHRDKLDVVSDGDWTKALACSPIDMRHGAGQALVPGVVRRSRWPRARCEEHHVLDEARMEK